MPPSYTPNLAIHKPATGEEAGTWGTTANRNYDVLDTAIDGNMVVPVSGSTYTLVTNQDAVSTGHNKVIIFTGTLTADISIIISPNTLEKVYYMLNHTAGGFALNVSQGSGTPYKIANGYSAVVYSDGLGATGVVKGALADFQVNSLLVAANLTVQGQVVWSNPATFNQPATFQALATFQAGATISAPLTLTLGGDQPWDLFYRSPGGQVARLGNGGAGQVLTASISGPIWVTPSGMAINAPVAGSSSGLIFFADQTARLVQDVNLVWKPGAGLAIGKASPSFAVDVNGDVNVSGQFRINGVVPVPVTGGLTVKSVVTGSRSLGSVYINASGKPMYVAVTCAVGALSFIQLLSDAGNPPTTINAAATNAYPSATAMQSVSGWVMPGHTYQVTFGSATLSTWIEAT